jgi:hypothetical protein
MSNPDWLEDVASQETKGPVPAPAASHEIPEWLEDLRLWYGLEAPPPPPAAAPVLPPLPLAGPESWDIDVELLAECALRETGFDPRTGEIRDAKQFQKWKGQKIGSPATNGSLLESFHQARLAIDTWVDDDSRRAFVLHGDLKEIANSPEVVGILDHYASRDPVAREKLLRRLAFMVENRRKYYAALGTQ